MRNEVTRAAATTDAATRARAGSLERIVREHSVPLARTLAFVTLDRQAAADIAQETFLRLYLHWDTVAEHPDLTAWLYRVALNRAKDHRRALGRAGRLVERLAAGAANTDEARQWEPQPDLMNALRALPRRQREATALHYVGDLPISEVARAMGISEGAAKTHLVRARQALKSILEEK